MTTALDIPVAPAGVSAVFCPKCHRHLSLDEEKNVRDSMGRCCGYGVFESGNLLSEGKLSLQKKSVPFLNEDGVRSARWFHATRRTNWYEGLFTNASPALAHLGDYDTAMERFSIRSKPGEKWRMYVVELLPTVTVSPEISADENVAAPQFARDLPYKQYQGDVTRYINEWESIGSISLLATPDSFRVVNEVELEEKSVWKFLKLLPGHQG